MILSIFCICQLKFRLTYLYLFVFWGHSKIVYSTSRTIYPVLPPMLVMVVFASWPALVISVTSLKSLTLCSVLFLHHILSEGGFFAVKEVSLYDQGSNAKQCITQLEQVCFIMLS
jgi:hypothetical protein